MVGYPTVPCRWVLPAALFARCCVVRKKAERRCSHHGGNFGWELGEAGAVHLPCWRLRKLVPGGWSWLALLAGLVVVLVKRIGSHDSASPGVENRLIFEES